MADRKRKGKVVSSSSQVIPRFKTLYHEAHFNSKLSARRILPELILQADEHVFNPIRFQIHQRKWEKFTKPIQAVGHLMVKEFYANAWEPDKAKRKHLTYTSMVRGTEISFAPSNIKRVLKLRKDPIPNAPSYHERKANDDFRLDDILYDMCEEGAEWVRHRDGRPLYLRRSDLEPMPKALCADAKIPAILDDTLIPQEPPIVAEEMARIREPRTKNLRQTRQATPPQQQPQVQHQQEFPAGFYTHFDTAMSQIHRKLDQHQEENRRSFEAINTRMDQMDDQLSFLCYSNQIADEDMLFLYRNTTRQFKEMEMQGIPVNMANLAINRQREEEINQERMRSKRILQEAAAQQARNKGKSREVVLDSEDEFHLKSRKIPKKKQDELIREDISEMKKKLHNDP
ncbi:hypothetical protein PIB30_074880 [Stylosanthes scabra]|uniref:Putative plant transposon protein domain-containing protein n=1 Tax=Stylosanthes scabra TaxID=79078 RepID=A0ABU6UP64_9FABA|nr:hypothetical protein [Stylosanthes scabra]